MSWADTIHGNYTTRLSVVSWTNNNVDLQLLDPRVHAFVVPYTLITTLCFIPLFSLTLVVVYGWPSLRAMVWRVSVPLTLVHAAVIFTAQLARVAHNGPLSAAATVGLNAVGVLGILLVFWKAGKAVGEPRLWHFGAFNSIGGGIGLVVFVWVVLPAFYGSSFLLGFMLRVVLHTVLKACLCHALVVLAMRLRNTPRAMSATLVVPVIFFVTFGMRFLQMGSSNTLYVVATEACLSVAELVEMLLKLSRSSAPELARALWKGRKAGGPGAVAIMYTPEDAQPQQGRRDSEQEQLWQEALFFVSIVKAFSLSESASAILAASFLLVARVNLKAPYGAPLRARQVLLNVAIVVAFESVVSDFALAFINAKYATRLNQYEMAQTWTRKPRKLLAFLYANAALLGCWAAFVGFGAMCVTDHDGTTVLTPCPG